ncbi:hypothetical protein SO802_012454 [Lithocarpus litseifolius]|uniref:Uncharacterized protein n=1 Tax=Lithocarpus litseifolius TaxID=425828 RepID=A0AAW2D2S3_9ROSI
MEVGANKKHKNVQKAVALTATAIREGKLQLPGLGEKRKLSMDTSPQTFGTVTRPMETPNRPSSTITCPVSSNHPRAPGRGKGPFTPPLKPPLLVHNTFFAVKQALSIIREEDIDDCDEYALASTRESGLHDLTKANLFISAEAEKVCLSKELGKLQGELSNVEMRDVAKYFTFQEYLKDLGIQYVRGLNTFVLRFQ